MNEIRKVDRGLVCCLNCRSEIGTESGSLCIFCKHDLMPDAYYILLFKEYLDKGIFGESPKTPSPLALFFQKSISITALRPEGETTLKRSYHGFTCMHCGKRVEVPIQQDLPEICSHCGRGRSYNVYLSDPLKSMGQIPEFLGIGEYTTGGSERISNYYKDCPHCGAENQVGLTCKKCSKLI